MQPKPLLKVTTKELFTFFSSPIGYIFLGVFLLVNLFVFFWVEAFFSRNIADVRPLFQWMPILLIFLVAAITMRMWSEERQMGTLEFLLTLPVKIVDLVLGKWFACMLLVCIALLLTIPLPITVAQLGQLDWGPVIGAYLATLLLAASYIAIGLMVSANNENQIVSLILTVLICSVFYLLGSATITDLFGQFGGELLQQLGSGSRFTAITRGVIDLRDLCYYLSLVGIFICLNIYSLERIRWAGKAQQSSHRKYKLAMLLIIINFIVVNVWLSMVNSARVDLTESKIYSISDATKGYFDQLQEPLLIRGYFSGKTHPLLAPLVPQLRDLITEYEVAGKGKVRAEFLDPKENPELEQEAKQKYNIEPATFQVQDRYSAALVSSYFNVLIQYGDEYVVLGFRELIDVKVEGEADIEVVLRNPEYDITRAIKKVLYEFQSAGNVFANIPQDVKFIGYVSADAKLPEPLREFRQSLVSQLEKFKQQVGDRFSYDFQDPEIGNQELAARIAEDFGFRPMRASLFDPNTFYFYMILQSGNEVIQVPFPEDLNEEGLRRSLEAGLKRFSSGFLKTIGINIPVPKSPNPYGQPAGGQQFNMLQEQLNTNYTVKPVTLDKGTIPEVVDILWLLAPKQFTDKQLFAVDQFLMKGGTVVLATSPFKGELTRTNLQVTKYQSGLTNWLAAQGVQISPVMVLDPQNAQLPIPIKRRVGGFTFQEMRLLEYPYFADIRSNGINQDTTLTAALPQVTMHWASPIELDTELLGGKKITPLFHSTELSWTSDATDVIPDLEQGPLGFKAEGKRSSHLLAVAIEGSFQSFYQGKDSPLLQQDGSQSKTTDDNEQSNVKDDAAEATLYSGVIERSPASARIILFASNNFLDDQMLQLSASIGGKQQANSLQLAENVVDWSLEDRGLLSIRSQDHFSRILERLDKKDQVLWEYLNYALALLGLILVYLGYHFFRSRVLKRQQLAV